MTTTDDEVSIRRYLAGRRDHGDRRTPCGAASALTSTGSARRTRCSSARCPRGVRRLDPSSTTPPKKRRCCSYRYSSTVASVWGAETEPLIAETFRLAPGTSEAAAPPRRVRPITQAAHRLPARPGGRLLGGASAGGWTSRPVAWYPSPTSLDGRAWPPGLLAPRLPQRLRRQRDAGDPEHVRRAHVARRVRARVPSCRLDHQVGQLEAGAEPDDFVDPTELSPLTRRLSERGLPRGRLGPTPHRQRPRRCRCQVTRSLRVSSARLDGRGRVRQCHGRSHGPRGGMPTSASWISS